MPQGRNRQLDILRAVAVLLVIGQHYEGTAWQRRFGWAGVDLFFVLSGFLVSGLLFDELARSRRVDSVRFLIRRGFKIYPAFWVMIGVTVVTRLLLHQVIDRRALACELLFLQNYGPGLWAPTWSLAVEEHFYFALALTFAWMVRRHGSDWTARLPRAIAVLLVLVLALRCAGVLLIPQQYKLTFWGTHARVDALLSGVCVAYWHRAKHEQIAAWARGNRWTILAASLALIAPAAVLGDQSSFTRTIGLTPLYLGFGGLLVVFLYAFELSGLLSRALASIGRYSYGIYIWQLPIYVFVTAPLVARGWLPPRIANTSVFFFATSVLGGMLLSRLIETPALMLRERWFPARTEPVVSGGRLAA